MPEAMVEGEPITHEEASAPGWIDAIGRRAISSATTTGKPAGASIGALRTGAATRVAAASRLPPLPTDHHRVIVRPGVDWMCPTAAEEDIACTNDTQNIFVISTPSLQRAEARLCTTNRSVVRGVDADLPDSELQRLFVSSHNSTLMGVRRIKDTTTIILLLDGLKVLNYVRCSMLLVRCMLYKRQINTCRNCGRVGHRQDVCPTPSEKVCEHCGIKPTGPDHQPNERIVEAPTPAAPAAEPVPTTLWNANRAAKRGAAEDPPDEPVNSE
ncbi:hypothetical protein HPB52_005644 [Rhipicephalus sanguineus]|uniref:CCHC-type domain-containing protein n=1 Tax=Rhipicephalus sanguineus TaxID=34632 RepID=A0A9D4PKV8_RHISA|nr:hypothetical protein HPB52_005644 [Rhipicephalus sanguineus]